MTHSFELKTGKKIDLTTEEFSEFVELIRLFTNSLPDKVIYKSVPYPIQFIPYPELGYPIVTCGEGKCG